MGESDLYLVTLLGCLKRNSPTRAIANTLDELAPDDVQISLLDSVGDLPLFNEDIEDVGLPSRVTEMGDMIMIADGVVIVTPQYCNSLPGGLKNALDWLCRLPYPPFAGKSVAIQTASHDQSGGGQAGLHLRDTLVGLDARLMQIPEVMITNCDSVVNPATGLVCQADARHRISRQLEAFAEFIRRSRAPV